MKYVLSILLITLAVPAQGAPDTWREPVTGMPFLAVQPACFQMGSEDPVGTNPGRIWRSIGYERHLSEDEMPAHRVCLDAFWIGQYEVRQGDWNKIMVSGTTATDPAVPVTNVSWAEAREFAQRLSEQTGERFRLPTEAEWEHACRAGFKEPRVATSDQLIGDAWYSRNDARRAEVQPVGLLTPNPFGLHDMLGNAWEWTGDTYIRDGYSHHSESNPQITAEGSRKVIRGGSFRTEPRQTRCTSRGQLEATQQLESVGFRLVKEIEE